MKLNKTIKTTMSLAAAMGCLAVSSASAATSLIHHWALDGNANDSVGTTHLTEHNSPTYVTGQFGNAVSLNGTSQTLRSGQTAGATTGGADPFPTGDFSWTMWVYQDVAERVWVGGTQSGGSGVHLFAETTQKANFRAGSSVTVADNTIPVGAWAHIAVTYVSSSGLTSVYVDGSLKGSGTTTPSSIENFTIGGRPDRNDEDSTLWDGLIDDVAIFDGVLDSTQLNNVRTLGAASFAIPEPSTTALLGLGGLALILRRRK